MKSCTLATLAVLVLMLATGVSPVAASDSVIVVLGAEGDEAFRTNFVNQVDSWEETCARAAVPLTTIGRTATPGTNDCDLLKSAISAEPKEGDNRLWVVLIGHGTFDGKAAKFNLRGPDVSATELAGWLRPFRRLLVIVNTSSSSGPFINALTGTNRAVVTATRSGYEENYTRFGGFLAQALSNPEADLDKDHQVSLLEAFLRASRQTSEFYKTEGRIATEHALLDDNGDGLGTPADWFKGLRATRQAKEKAGVDGLLASQICLVPGTAELHWTAEQRAHRDSLERAVLLHRARRGEMPEDEYYRQLEALLLPLAEFYSSNRVARPMESTAR
jgi:hypothetical protein